MSSNPIQKKIHFFAIIAGVMFGAMSVAAFTFGSWILGPILGIIALVGIYSGFTSGGVAICPSCSQEMPVDFGQPNTGSRGFVECPHCAEWARIENGGVNKLPSGFVRDSPAFEVRLRTLSQSGHGMPGKSVWPWSGTCCVCRGTLDTVVTAKAHRETFGAVMGVTIENFQFPVPCCSAHLDGLTWEVSGSVVTTQISIVSFRSYDYWRAFREANADVVAPPDWGGEFGKRK